MRKTAILIASFMLGAGLLWAKDFWKEKPYTEWTQEEARRMVSDSPWARVVRVTTPAELGVGTPEASPTAGMGAPGGSEIGASPVGGAPAGGPVGPPAETGVVGPERVFNVWWYSARSWRGGMARFQMLRGGITPEQAKSFVEDRPPDYIIAVRSDDMRLFQALSEESLRSDAYLRSRRTKLKLAPSSVEFQRSSDGQRITMIRFHFPRTAEGEPFITPDDKGIDFVCAIRGINISTTFDVRNMKVGGELDL